MYHQKHATYNLPHHFLARQWVKFERNVSKCLIIYRRLFLKMHKQMIQTLRKSLMVTLASTLQVQGFLGETFIINHTSGLLYESPKNSENPNRIHIK